MFEPALPKIAAQKADRIAAQLLALRAVACSVSTPGMPRCRLFRVKWCQWQPKLPSHPPPTCKLFWLIQWSWSGRTRLVSSTSLAGPSVHHHLGLSVCANHSHTTCKRMAFMAAVAHYGRSSVCSVESQPPSCAPVCMCAKRLDQKPSWQKSTKPLTLTLYPEAYKNRRLAQKNNSRARL